MPNSFDSRELPKRVGLYQHAAARGESLFLSGVGPRERGTRADPGVEPYESGEIVSYDIETQSRALFQNVVIIEDAGSSWDRSWTLRFFLTNMKADFEITIALCRTLRGEPTMPDNG